MCVCSKQAWHFCAAGLPGLGRKALVIQDTWMGSVDALWLSSSDYWMNTGWTEFLAFSSP